MAHTPAQRSKHALCGAKRRNGEPCRKFAGEGTEHRGIGRCKFHGGNTPNHNKNAVAVVAARRMITLGQPLASITSRDALLGLLRATAGHVAWLHGEVGATEDLAGMQGQVLVKLYSAERDRLAAIAKACLDSGIDEDTIRVTEAQVGVLGSALLAACEDAGLDPEQRQALGAALRAHLSEADVQSDAQTSALGPFA